MLNSVIIAMVAAMQ